MREIRQSGSEGGETGQPVFPTPIGETQQATSGLGGLSILICGTRGCVGNGSGAFDGRAERVVRRFGTPAGHVKAGVAGYTERCPVQ